MKMVEEITECKLLNAPLKNSNDVCGEARREFDKGNRFNVRIKEVRDSEAFSAMAT